MKKIKITNFIFVQDGFGPLPVWSLQHPKKESREAYLIHVRDIKDKPKWLKDILILQKIVNKASRELVLTPADIYNVSVSGELTFEIIQPSKIIKDFKMTYWDMNGTIIT